MSKKRIFFISTFLFIIGDFLFSPVARYFIFSGFHHEVVAALYKVGLIWGDIPYGLHIGSMAIRYCTYLAIGLIYLLIIYFVFRNEYIKIMFTLLFMIFLFHPMGDLIKIFAFNIGSIDTYFYINILSYVYFLMTCFIFLSLSYLPKMLTRPST